MTRTSQLVLIFISAFLLGGSTGALGSIEVDATKFSRPSMIPFAVGGVPLRSEGNAIEIGSSPESVMWTATPGGIVVDSDAAFNGRGYWRSFERRGFCTVDIVSPVEVRFDFKAYPVAAVGAFMNYTTDWPGSPTGVWIEALGSNGSVLESYNLYTDAPIPGDGSIDNGGFRGIVRAQNDIAGFRIRTDGAYFAIDDLTFARISSGKAINLSCRSKIAVGGLLNPGFAIVDGPATVLIRAIGPGLVEHGVPNPIADPKLDVFKGNTIIASNDDWETPEAGTSAVSSEDFLAAGAFPLISGSSDAAIVLQLPPGAYTALARSASSSDAGDVLVEVYVFR